MGGGATEPLGRRNRLTMFRGHRHVSVIGVEEGEGEGAEGGWASSFGKDGGWA
jgi:hypothetical protein